MFPGGGTEDGYSAHWSSHANQICKFQSTYQKNKMNHTKITCNIWIVLGVWLVFNIEQHFVVVGHDKKYNLLKITAVR